MIIFAFLGGNLLSFINSPYFPINPASENAVDKIFWGMSLSTWQLASKIFKELEPFAYGGLGACAYLLRIAHIFIQKREFDLRRQSEYMNRILLGILSGGMIILFINPEDVHVGAAALGFIAGYSTDTLFSIVERVINAVMPNPKTLKAGNKPDILPISLEKLMEMYKSAVTDDEKKLIQNLIDQLKKRV